MASSKAHRLHSPTAVSSKIFLDIVSNSIFLFKTHNALQSTIFEPSSMTGAESTRRRRVVNGNVKTLTLRGPRWS